MDQRSETILAEVHPDLAKVIRAAHQEPQPFEVTYGLRTLADEAQAVASGHSQTMHSRHLPHYKTGLAYAVDVSPIEGGKITFAKGHEAHVYGAIAIQIMETAKAAKVPLEWGGDWVSWKDWGHFQLPWRAYP